MPETRSLSGYLDGLILESEQLLSLGHTACSVDRESWMQQAQRADVLPALRNRLLRQVQEECNLSRTLKAIRLLNDEQLLHVFIDLVQELKVRPRNWTLMDLKDRKLQLGLIVLSNIEHIEAQATLASLAPQGMVYVPPGEFIMGNDSDPAPDEMPKHQVWLSGFYIRRCTSTMAEYRRFILEGGYEIETFWTRAGWEWRHKFADIAEARWQMLTQAPSDDYSVNWTNWYEAMAFASWSGATLPTEAQWEKAARGTDARIYPWGNEFDENLCSTDVLNLQGPTKPGHYSPRGDSPYGVADMAGNLLEWVTSLYMPYPYQADDARENPDAQGQRIHRGGAWSNPPFAATTYHRRPNEPYEIHVDHGIRLVQAPDNVYMNR